MKVFQNVRKIIYAVQHLVRLKLVDWKSPGIIYLCVTYKFRTFPLMYLFCRLFF